MIDKYLYAAMLVNLLISVIYLKAILEAHKRIARIEFYLNTRFDIHGQPYKRVNPKAKRKIR